MLLHYALLCFLTGGYAIKIQDIAVPSALHAGADAELQCATDPAHAPLIVKWWWSALGGGATRQLYQRFRGQAAQALHLNGRKIEFKSNDTIVLRGLQPEDSGHFECEVTASAADEDREKRKLVVFTEGTGPVLNVTSVADGDDPDDEEDILITCSAHDVAPKPDITITINGEPSPAAHTRTQLSEAAGGRYNITTSVNASGTHARLRCEMFYEDADISHPAYYTDLEVLAGADEATTEPQSEVTDSNTEPLEVAATDSPQTGNGASRAAASALLLTLVLFYYN